MAENQLAVQLGEEHKYLLCLLWRHLCVTHPSGDIDLWPVWDYLARGLYHKFPSLENAADVLLDLPTVPCHRLSNGRYGLVWRKNDSTTREPQSDERIGLSIAGFASLAAHGENSAWVADGLVAVIADLARQEEKLPSGWNTPATGTRDLEAVSTLYLKQTQEHPEPPLPPGIVGPVLQHEFPSLDTRLSGGTWSLTLGHPWLRPYRTLHSAAEYLDTVCELASQQEASARHTSPLTLVQTLDYLSYVLAADPRWGTGRLVQAPDLQAASSLVSAVATRSEFETAMSGLCTVIDQMKTPKIPQSVVEVEHKGIQPGSQARLEYWLKECLAGGQGLQRVLEAMKDIRAARHIRVDHAHSDADTRKNAIKARRRLGLPEVTADWTGAWDTIRVRVAAAFDVIRQEIQGYPPPATD